MIQTQAQSIHQSPIRRALLSVFNKTGLVELARALAAHNVELLASGGSAKALADAGIKVIQVDAFTQSPEVLGGRVKTLHPRIHAGILAHRGDPSHLADLEKNSYPLIDLVVCNLYPFADVLKKGAPRNELIENIDIGGPTLVRAAAKNADGGMTVLVDPNDYNEFIKELKQTGKISLGLRQKAQAKAFRQVAEYDLLIAKWTEDELSRLELAASLKTTNLPEILPSFCQVRTLRYGENPHQAAALYVTNQDQGGIAKGSLLAGKELSYTNLLDLDAAYRDVWGLKKPACSIIKHTNPCGLAMADTQTEAFTRALSGDPVSAFGSVLGFNEPLTGETAAAIRATKLFVECIAAPDFTTEALAEFKERENLRLFKVPAGSPLPTLSAHRIGGGMLVQQTDPGFNSTDDWRCATKKQPEAGWIEELAFAMRVVWVLKSNAIALTKNATLLGSGTGQTSRVDATEHALKKAGEKTNGAFLASDAFFPFDDSVRMAAKAGIIAIVQPGGSKRDEEVIRACDELGLCMMFTGKRHFRH
ncbi:MAG: bifunctional phosphoribosylaminoimidazolecarboxamide formyltransferase/IMP cyclohydrolase [Deltaproteobacteria bacterium]|nr:bifunctional phosphoribosylaminoimidazolecarboxamide formyltransferase/IMP cyclohydrolase [Deltaproteobacteria bacterium]